jgi:hypothetical protein
METVEERRELVLTFCRSVKRSAKLAIGYSDTLLEETGTSLNKEQAADFVRICAAAERILEMATKAIEEVNNQDHRLDDQAYFEHFLRVTFHDLRAQISLIIGFSRVALDEITGPLTAEQKGVLVQIEALGRTLASSVTGCQNTVWPAEPEGEAVPLPSDAAGTPQIDSYRFGHIVIDGQAHTKDVIILPKRVIGRWWRVEGHALHPDDLRDVLEVKPEVLVVGTGTQSQMRVTPETKRVLEAAGIELIVEDTQAATETYHRLRRSRVVAAALHLTC